MRTILLLAVLAAWSGTNHILEAQTKRIDLPWGYIEASNNEVTIVSTVDDPPGVRLAARYGSSLGKLSFNWLRDDGKQEELVLLQGKRDDRYSGLSGELSLHLRHPERTGDTGMVPILNIFHDYIVFHVPVYRSNP